MRDPAPFELVREVLEKEFAIPATAIRPGAHLVDDLDLDSLDLAYLALLLEQRVGIRAAESALEAIETIDELVAVLGRVGEGRPGDPA
jgi:acyl carrier protein